MSTPECLETITAALDRFFRRPVAQRPSLGPAPWIAACVWVALALVLIYGRGRSLVHDRDVTDRLRFHAIPVAMSVLYHGHPHDYTSHRYLALRFQTPGASINGLIDWAQSAKLPTGWGTYYWAADDRGMADYVIAAFKLFGPSVPSLYKFYFVVLAVSCALFLIGYWREPTMTATLLFALASIYSCVAVIPWAHDSGSVAELPSLFEPRILDLLAFVATVHLAFAAWAPGLTWRWLLATAGQVGVFVFCYHARSSLGWEAVFIIAANLFWLAWSWIGERRRSRPPTPAVPLTAVALLLFAAGFATLLAYKHAVYNPRYFRDMGSRTIWHNALMGLGSNPAIKTKYNLTVSDSDVVDAVIASMRDRGDARLTKDWTTTNILNSLGGHVEFNWYDYESAARRLYLDIWRTDPADALPCYLVDKPHQVVNDVVNVVMSEIAPARGFPAISGHSASCRWSSSRRGCSSRPCSVFISAAQPLQPPR